MEPSIRQATEEVCTGCYLGGACKLFEISLSSYDIGDS